MTEKDRVFKAFQIGFVIGFLFCLITMYFVSCQPTDPLKGLNCPCKVITADTTPRGNVVTYIDKDGKLSKPVISEALYEQYKKNNELNK